MDVARCASFVNMKRRSLNRTFDSAVPGDGFGGLTPCVCSSMWAEAGTYISALTCHSCVAMKDRPRAFLIDDFTYHAEFERRF
jgi:hypothetical protein